MWQTAARKMLNSTRAKWWRRHPDTPQDEEIRSAKATEIHLIYLVGIEFIHFNDYIYHCVRMHIHFWWRQTKHIAIRINRTQFSKYLYKLKCTHNIAHSLEIMIKGEHIWIQANILYNDSGFSLCRFLCAFYFGLIGKRMCVCYLLVDANSYMRTQRLLDSPERFFR